MHRMATDTIEILSTALWNLGISAFNDKLYNVRYMPRSRRMRNRLVASGLKAVDLANIGFLGREAFAVARLVGEFR